MMLRKFLLPAGLLLSLTACVSTSVTPPVTCVDEAAIYRATDNRNAGANIFDQALLCDETAAVRLGLLGLGRIGGERALTKIRSRQNDPRDTIREMAAFATGISGARGAVDDLMAMLREERAPEVREQIYLGLGNIGGSKALGALNSAIEGESDQRARAAIFQGLGIAFAFQRDAGFNKSTIDFETILVSASGASISKQAAFMLARVRDLPTHLSFDALQQYLASVGNEAAVAYLIRAAARYQSTEEEQLDTSNRALDLILGYTQDRHLGTRVEAVRALGQFVGLSKATAAAVTALNDRNELVQGTALQSLSRLGTSDPEQARQIMGYLDAESPWLAGLALNTVATLDPRAALERGRSWLIEGEASEKQRGALTILNRLAPGEVNELLEPFVESSDRLLRSAARQAISPEPAAAESAKRWPDSLPEVSRVTLETTRGRIVIELFPDTPYTAANFAELARSGFYDDSVFSRVIPNFVAQGGDNVGHGGGSVGYTIREELSMRSHVPGTVGQATSGKDTGGGQFFINLAPNLHLDHNYTIFGQVIAGMEVAYRLQQGDRILAVSAE